MDAEISNSKTQVLIAALGLIGVLCGAIFSNWDKLFPPARTAHIEANADGKQIVGTNFDSKLGQYSITLYR